MKTLRPLLFAAFLFQAPTGRFDQSLSIFRPISGYSTIQTRLAGELTFKAETGPIYWTLTPQGWLDVPSTLEQHKGVEPFIDAKEAMGEVRTDWVDLRAGSQIVAWGAADQINPTDVVNSRNYWDPILSQKISAPLLRADFHPPELEFWNLQMVVSPLFRPSQLPIRLPDSGVQSVSVYDSRWMMSVPEVVSIGGVKHPLKYEVAAPSYPATWGAGGRLSASSLFGWDWSLSTYNGVESVPRMAVTARGDASVAELPMIVTLHPSYHRFWVFGFDGESSYTIGDQQIGVRFELAYTHRDNSRVGAAPSQHQSELRKNPFLLGVIGADYTLPGRVWGTVMYANLQYVHEQRFGAEAKPGSIELIGLPTTQIWDRNLVLYVENRTDFGFKISQILMTSFKNWDAFWNPKGHYQFTDTFNMSFGPQLFMGNDNGFFGQFRDNSRFVLDASYLF